MLSKHTRIISSGIFVIITILLFFPSRLIAGTENKTKTTAVDSYLRYIPSSGVKAQSGEVGIIDSDAEYSYQFKLFDELPVKFFLGHQYISIENTTAVKLPAHLVGLSTGIETTFAFFKFNNTYLHLAVSPSFYSDNWDFYSSSFRMPTQTFLIYQPDARWTFIAGVAVCADAENPLWPLLGFIYKPNDKLTFNLIPKRPNINYALNDRVNLFIEGGAALSQEFEVTKENLKNVILSYKEMRLGTGLKYQVNKFMQGSILLGGIFKRSLKYKDSLGKVNIKDSLYSEFRLELKI